MNLLAGAGQLPAVEIERERTKANAHCEILGRKLQDPWKSPGTYPPRGGYFTCANPRVRRVIYALGPEAGGRHVRSYRRTRTDAAASLDNGSHAVRAGARQWD